MTVPSSFGTHFRPDLTRTRDFLPETAVERQVIQDLEEHRVQVGLYLFGTAVATSDPSQYNFRALKGPAAITAGTPRPSPVRADALPAWKDIYPIAHRAMQSFRNGDKGFETRVNTWDIAVRPLTAVQDRCVACHNNPSYGRVAKIQLDDPIGGIIYAFRTATP